jgi:class 3 adenylate cyclase
MLLWEPDGEMALDGCLVQALDAAFEIHKKYWYLTQEVPYATPSGYGIGIAIGEAIRVQPETFLQEMNEVDFLGYPLNCAARMQSLSGAFGTTVSARVAKIMEADSENFLHPSEPAFTRVLQSPSAEALRKAVTMKGLDRADRTEFRHLVWPRSQALLWRTDRRCR